MAKYQCFNCGANLTEEDIKDFIRCPKCGGRILIKLPPDSGIKVKAR
ncbi:MAG: DNA-directed RNA polymerase subunit P [Candidatus Rehaiarchaeum fermentans]|nr:DNA-directed RNA polymerase subunit P [Candidatus Rehaiarchaeum fermentans]MCW1292478.1 DNA-directed RNA polymerase subunit P [Candidatus Rehaiarchaeum fermentans]MCW1297129.1 DNA-directed RNA polymerase subunit P [Candidatus Rehaiarchaeum fermentans]MCW1302533.1 DNA-directed RNA polymerase subunit P [Candidatus Rehaiarchaeum fermentans]MCW1311422.1 DNA-directed RNA polymerase subunit P [Candidatus Rehaiarchaeum fermentans]